MPEHIGVGIGFHPRHARNSRSSIDEGVRQLRRLLTHPRVVAFGEVGLDHTEPLKYWAYQVEFLEKVLPYLEDRHVLVIHCRGMIGDCSTEAFLLLLHFNRSIFIVSRGTVMCWIVGWKCFPGRTLDLPAKWEDSLGIREKLCVRSTRTVCYSSLMPYISRLKLKQFLHPVNCTFLRRLWQHTVS